MSLETTGMPRSLGRYELVHLLGQGGMGEVWLAKISGVAGFEKPCIVKTILPALLKDSQFLDRFHHEAKVLVHLVHSSIAQVYDMGEAEGTCYIALEYVAGVDLAYVEEQARAQGQLMPVPVSLYLGQRMAEGLGYAHRKAGPDGSPLGIVHRDVSPHNVMVSYEGEVKVIDFGLAKSAARSKYTLPSTVMGKLGYMSPEQARAEPVDHRSDIYSCGVVAWELLAGRSLVPHGTVGEMMAAMVHPTVPALHELRPDVSPELDAVVRRALAPRAEERYARADDFARALAEQQLRTGASVGGEEVGTWVRTLCPEAFAAQRRLISKISSPSLRRTPADAGPTGTARFSPLPGTPGSVSGYEATALRPASPVPTEVAPAVGLVGTPGAVAQPSAHGPASGGPASALTPTPGAAAPAFTPAPGGVGGQASGPLPASAPRMRPAVLAVLALGLVGATAGVTAFVVKGQTRHVSHRAAMMGEGPEDRDGPPFRHPPPDDMGMSGRPPPPEDMAGRPPPPPPEGPGRDGEPWPPPPGHRPPPPEEALAAREEAPPEPNAIPVRGDTEEKPAAVPATVTRPAERPQRHEHRELVSAKSVLGMFQDGAEHFVRGGSNTGLEMGTVLTVVGPPVKGDKRRKFGEATVVEVWPALARVSLDDEDARTTGGKRFVVVPEGLAAPKATKLTEAAAPAPTPPPEAAPPPPAETRKPLVGRAAFSGIGPFRKINLFNTDTRTWNHCTVALVGRRSYDFGALAPGGTRGALVRQFRIDAQVPFLQAGYVAMLCDEGEGRFFVRE